MSHYNCYHKNKNKSENKRKNIKLDKNLDFKDCEFYE